MKPRYLIHVQGQGSWLDAIADQLEVGISDNQIFLPPDLGKGSIKEYKLDEGFYVTFGEMDLLCELQFDSLSSRKKQGIILLFKYMERGHSYFKPFGEEFTEVKSGGVHFFSSNVRNSVIYPADTHSYHFRVFLSMNWVKENMSEFIKQSEVFDDMVFGDGKIMHFEPLTNRFVRLFKDVFKSEFNEKLIPLIVKDKGYEAVVLFFDHFYRQFFHHAFVASRYSISDQKRLYALVDFIKKNLGRNLSLEELTREVGFSKSKLQAMFHYFFNQSIYAYIKNLKYEKAAEMLLNTDTDIRNVAHELGYNSSTHFINIFRDHFGVSPKKYRKSRHTQAMLN